MTSRHNPSHIGSLAPSARGSRSALLQLLGGSGSGSNLTSSVVTSTTTSSKSSNPRRRPNAGLSSSSASRSESSDVGDTSESRGGPYTCIEMIGQGAFGSVFRTHCPTTDETVAVKRVLQDPQYKLRELEIMKQLMQCPHPYLVKLKRYFYSKGTQSSNEVYLNLVMEYIPQTLYTVIVQSFAGKQRSLLPLYVQIYGFQLCRGLAHLHGLGISHRDLKPQNILVDTTRNVLKICDFGSAKTLMQGDPNIAYICSRYYRAPELIVGGKGYVCYSSAIDAWSAGCVLAEMLLGRPLFPGISATDQLIEITSILGTPTEEEIRDINPSNIAFRFPSVTGNSLESVLKNVDYDVIDLIKKMLAYSPQERISMIDCCAHSFFSPLRRQIQALLEDETVPSDICTFSHQELQHASKETMRILKEFAAIAFAHFGNTITSTSNVTSSSTSRKQEAIAPTMHTIAE